MTRAVAAVTRAVVAVTFAAVDGAPTDGPSATAAASAVALGRCRAGSPQPAPVASRESENLRGLGIRVLGSVELRRRPGPELLESAHVSNASNFSSRVPQAGAPRHPCSEGTAAASAACRARLSVSRGGQKAGGGGGLRSAG